MRKRVTVGAVLAACVLGLAGCQSQATKAVAAAQWESWTAQIRPLTERGLADAVEDGDMTQAHADFVLSGEVASFENSILTLRGEK